MANKKIVKSPFTINRATTGVTFTAADFATANEWKQIMVYAVPLGVCLEVTPINYHFGDLKETTTTKITAGMTRILKKNANSTEAREIWSGSNGIFKDIGDELQRPKIRVPVVVNASEQLIVEVYGLGTTLDVSASNYFVEAVQYYEEI